MSRNGMVLIMALFVVTIPVTLAELNFTLGGFTVPPHLIFLAWVSPLVQLYVMIVAYRAFASDTLQSFPRDIFRHRMLAVYIHIAVASVAFILAVGVGTLLLVIPGIYLLVTLWFFDIIIAVEDVGPVEGLTRSFEVTGGHRLKLFGLGVCVLVIVGAAYTALYVATEMIGGPVGYYFVLWEFIVAALTIFVAGTSVAVYQQLEGETDTSQPFYEPDANVTVDRSGG